MDIPDRAYDDMQEEIAEKACTIEMLANELDRVQGRFDAAKRVIDAAREVRRCLPDSIYLPNAVSVLDQMVTLYEAGDGMESHP